MDADGERCLHRAEAGQIDRHVLTARDRDPDRYRGTASATTSRRRRRGLHKVEIGGDTADE